MRPLLSVSLLLLLFVSSVSFAAHPMGSSSDMPSAGRGGPAPYRIYLQNGSVLRAKRQPVFLYARCVSSDDRGRPINIPASEVDVPRTQSQGKVLTKDQLVIDGQLTNRELKEKLANRTGRISVGVGSIDDQRDTINENNTPVEAVPDRPRGSSSGGPSSEAQMSQQRAASLERQRADLQTQLGQLQARKISLGSDPAGTASIDAQIRGVQGQIGDMNAQIQAARSRSQR